MEEAVNPIQSFIVDYREKHSEIIQNRLLDESALIRFSRDRGIAVSGVVKGDPSTFIEIGWLESDELAEADTILFHPFRIYPLHLVVESCRLKIAPSSSIVRETFGDFLTKVKDRLPSLDRISEKAKLANEIANIAILLEPIYWPIITSRTSLSGFVAYEDHKRLVESYKENVLSLIQELDVDEWRKRHENLRFKAAQLDDNGDIYILLRLSPWIKRERIKGHIAGALWFRHMAELIRRAFKEVYDVIWPEEDQAFEQWFPGDREEIYGSEYPTEDPARAKPHVAFEFGLHTGSTVRWYLEGETEYYAALYILPRAASGGIELVNLKGAVGNERANAALRLADGLVKDKELRRFSFISFDMDVAANVKAIRRQVQNGNVVGYINGHSPDFEFGNFTLDELVEVAAQMDVKHGANAEKLRNGDWSNISSGSQFEENYRKLTEIGQKGLKGEEWGTALAEFALKYPYFNEKKQKRPFLETVNHVLHSRRVKYDYQTKHYYINPESFQIEKIPNE
ncbi:MAG: hypothetical protein HQ551_07950 [Desulfobacteraceae bacterium]|nr:hypothetical protein [Desulfobacteraceae bacterium]